MSACGASGKANGRNPNADNLQWPATTLGQETSSKPSEHAEGCYSGQALELACQALQVAMQLKQSITSKKYGSTSDHGT